MFVCSLNIYRQEMFSVCSLNIIKRIVLRIVSPRLQSLYLRLKLCLCGTVFNKRQLNIQITTNIYDIILQVPKNIILLGKFQENISRGGGLFSGWGLGSICWSCYMPIYLAVSTLFQLPDCGGKSSLLDEELWDLQNKCIMHVYIII